jgi:hypothetical protein
MPFTFSHPAIILPLTYLPKKWFSLTGLIIGSLTPDFEYFIRMKIKSDYSHTIEGLFWFDLPLGILLAFIFHNIVRNTLLDNLPKIIKSRSLQLIKLDWNAYFKKNWFVVIVSILIGAFSHLFWDSFTHNHGYFVENIPTLRKTVTILGMEIQILKILQHSSTIIGGVIILLAIYKLPKVEIKTNKINFTYWKILIGVTLLITTIRLMSGLEIREYGNLIVTGISAGLIGLILTPKLMKIINTGGNKV